MSLALPYRPVRGTMQIMKQRRFTNSRPHLFSTIFLGLLAILVAPGCAWAAPSPAAVAAFNAYISAVEARLAEQHRSQGAFLAATTPQGDAKLRNGESIVERVSLSSGAALPGAMMFHWRGTAFAPGAKPADFDRVMRDFNSYPQRFAPQVVAASVVSQQGDRFQAWMRIRQRHVISVVMDTAYDVTFAQTDARHGYSISRSTGINEIDSPGTRHEHVLAPGDEHGFLWRLNTYWSYEERDGGLYLQIETVSLSRSVPAGIGWAIGPYVQTVPRESLEFTLSSACNAMRRQ